MTNLKKLMMAIAGAVLAVGAFAANLPAEYTAVDYIVASRGAYIDTGYKPNQDTRTVMDVTVQGTSEYWFSVTDEDYTTGAYALCNDYDLGIYYAVGNDGGSFKLDKTTDGCVPNGRHKLEITPYSMLVDGKVWATKVRKGNFQLENNLYIFASNALSTRKNHTAYTRDTQTSIICHGCTIIEGDTPKRNFVPCVRKADAVVGFYDTVEGKFYTNVGTGVFGIVEPILPAEYTVVNYIVAPRGAYIDTGYKPNQNTHTVMDVTVQVAGEYWFGCWDEDYNKGAYALGNDGYQGVYFGIGNNGGSYIQPSTDAGVLPGRHTVEIDNWISKFDGEKSYNWRDDDNPDLSDFQLKNNLYLFAQNRKGTMSVETSQTSIICHGCTISEGNTPKRNFVPCVRKMDAVVGLYDTVERKFYTSVSSIAFSLEPLEPVLQVNYIDSDGEEQVLKSSYLKVSPKMNTFNDGWYVVMDEVQTVAIDVRGTVNLILEDGAKLTVSGGIRVEDDGALNIYGQKAGTGELIAKGAQDCAGIGGGAYSTCGTVTVNGGMVTATGGAGGAGIGGGTEGGGGTVTVNGGVVTATGGIYGAGIGGGAEGVGGTVTVSGGTVTAKGSVFGAGIGGGAYGAGGTIVVNDGTVTATGGTEAAGIGGGGYRNGNGGKVTVSGGTVKATGGTYGAGIGGGNCGAGGIVMVSGGRVTATGGQNGSVIGGGYNGEGGDVTMSGGIFGMMVEFGWLADGYCVVANPNGATKAAYPYAVVSGGVVVSIPAVEGALISIMANRVPVVGFMGGNLSICENTMVTVDYTAKEGYTLSGETHFEAMVSGSMRLPAEGNEPTAIKVATVTVPAVENASLAVTTNGIAVTDFAGGKFVVPHGTAVMVDYTAFPGWSLQGIAHYEATVSGDLRLPAEGSEPYSTRFIGYMEPEMNVADGVVFVERITNALPVTAMTETLRDGWYFVEGDVLRAEINVATGCTANLILMDGAKLTVTGGFCRAGINVSSGKVLNVYGQGLGTGQLVAMGGAGNGYAGGAGIGGNYQGNGGTVTICGGVVTAEGGLYASGIGGGDGGRGGNVTIYGGTVMVVGKHGAQGLGAGSGKGGGTNIIYGGTVRAEGGEGAYGIGGDKIVLGDNMVMLNITDGEPGVEISDGNYFRIKKSFTMERQALATVTIGELSHITAAWTSGDGSVKTAISGAILRVLQGTPGVKIFFTPEHNYQFVDDNETGIRELESPITKDCVVMPPEVEEIPGTIVNPWRIGEAVTAYISEDGTLVIGGEGAMYDFASVADVPWAAVADDVMTVSIADGVTNVGQNVLAGMAGTATVNGTPLSFYDMMACARGSSVPVIPDGMVLVSKTEIQAAKAEAVKVENGVVTLGVNVCSNANFQAETKSWGKVDLKSDSVKVENGRIIISLPVSSQSGFVILQSGDAKIGTGN